MALEILKIVVATSATLLFLQCQADTTSVTGTDTNSELCKIELKIQAETDVAVEDTKKFAIEVLGAVSALKKNVDVGIKPSMMAEFKNTVKKYEKVTFSTDEFLITRFNMLSKTICVAYQLYCQEKSSETKSKLFAAFDSLQKFVDNYCLHDHAPLYRNVGNMSDLVSDISLCLAKVDNYRRQNSDEEIEIRLRAIHNKLDYFLIKLSKIDPLTNDLSDLRDIETLEQEFNKIKAKIDRADVRLEKTI